MTEHVEEKLPSTGPTLWQAGSTAPVLLSTPGLLTRTSEYVSIIALLLLDRRLARSTSHHLAAVSLSCTYTSLKVSMQQQQVTIIDVPCPGAWVRWHGSYKVWPSVSLKRPIALSFCECALASDHCKIATFRILAVSLYFRPQEGDNGQAFLNSLYWAIVCKHSFRSGRDSPSSKQ